MRFHGKVAVVTGAAAGLGRAVAQRLDAEGAHVSLLDMDEDGLNTLAGTLSNAVPYVVDVSQSEQVTKAFDDVLERQGKVDLVFNNAGIVGEQTPVHLTTDETWSRVMRVNADGAFYVLRASLAAMVSSGGGAVVNTSSSSGLSGKRNMAPYGFSKSGLVGLTRSAAIEYADRAIRVNAIAPTAVRTSLVEDHIARSPDPAAMERLLTTQTPIPGLPIPEDIAAVVAFLLSDEAKWITGLTVPVDGGYHAT